MPFTRERKRTIELTTISWKYIKENQKKVNENCRFKMKMKKLQRAIN